MKNFTKFLVLLLACSPAFAWAAMANIFEPTSGDVSLKILNQLFGGLVGSGDGHDAFGKAIETFNGAVLAVGGILAAYTVLAGTLGTAHDGEMLGKKFSSVWIPIRYSVGTALVIPISSAGYCGMQFLVMWLIVQGIGLADGIWSSYVDSPNAILSSKMQGATKRQILEFAKNTALAHGCVATIQNTEKTVLDTVLSTNAVWGYGLNPLNVNQYAFGKQFSVGQVAVGGAGGSGQGYSDRCGTSNIVAVVKPEDGLSVSSLVGSTGGGDGGRLGSFGIAFTVPDTTPVLQAHHQAGITLINSLAAPALAAAKAGTPMPYADVLKAANTYITSVEAAGDAYIASNDPFKDIKAQAHQQGWILAGAWYTKLTMLNAQYQKSMNSVPTASGTTQLSNTWYGFSDDAVKTLKDVQSEILKEKGTYTDLQNKTKDSENQQAESIEAVNGLSSWISSRIADATGLDIKNLQNDSRPAIIIIQELGDNMIDWWQGLMGVLMLASGFAALPFVGQTASSIINVVVSFLTIPISALVVTGFTLGYMLPNLPFLMWCGVILGWIIMTIEAILAAPLWAIMHLHPNGDDLTGRGGNGYMLLLGLILRPALTIFGLIAALVVTDLMGEFVNKVFFSVFYAGPISGMKSLLIMIFSIGIYTMAQFAMFKKTFSLMHVIPDQLMQWIGGGGSQLGQYAGSVADEAGRGVGAASVAAGFVGDKGIDALRGGSQAIRQHNELKANKNAQLEGNEIASLQSQNSSEDSEDTKFGQDGIGAANTEALSIKHGNAEFQASQSSPLQRNKDRMELKNAQIQFKNAGGDPMALAKELKDFKSNPANAQVTNSDAIKQSLSSVMTRMRETGEGSLAPEAPINPISEGTIKTGMNNSGETKEE